MNRIAKIAVATLLVAGAAFAQEKPEFGVHVGLGLTSFNGDDAKELDAGLGFAAGVAMVKPVGSALSLAPELLYSYRSASASDEDFEYTIKETAIDMPMLFRIALAPNVFVQGGPQFGIVLSSESTLEYDGESETVDNTNREALEYGLTVGAGVLVNEQLTLDLRYFYGMSKISKEGSADSTPYQMMLGGTYMF